MKNLLIAAAMFLSVASVSSPTSAACATQSISVGETKSGTLSADDCVDLNSNGNTYYYDYYTFTGTSGQQISILNTSSAIDPDMYLIYPDGSSSYNDDGGGGTSARIPPTSGYITLPATGTYSISASSSIQKQTGAYTLALSTSSGSGSTTTTTEFYNTTLKHYFVTASSSEAKGIDNGAAGPGWIRTGYSFNVAEAVAGTVPVCRFYGTPGVGPNSHFYTADAGECAFVKKDPGWFYEGIAFYIQLPQSGSCPAGTTPIYRVYNDRAAANDSNHRFIPDLWVYYQMVNNGWTAEGVVMCSTGVTATTGISGGNFADVSGSASVNIASGTIPSNFNVNTPSMAAVSQLPAGLDIDKANGDVNITKGATGYVFTLSGEGGLFTNNAGAVKISLQFNTAGIPAADTTSAIKIFIRLFNHADNSIVDMAGDIAVTGSTGTITVETRGLPAQFTAIVIYNPNMEAGASDEVSPSAFNAISRATINAVKTTWPTKRWCTFWNSANPNLIASVKKIRGLASNPSRAQIRSTVLSKISGATRKAQDVYEKDGFIGPDLYIGNICAGSTPSYYIHMSDKPSHFTPDDPLEVIHVGANHYGRIYMGHDLLAIAENVIAHEMHHAIQSSHRLWGGTLKGYKEGTATVYGQTITSGEVITTRDYADEMQLVSNRLMLKTGKPAYANQDFFAYVGKQYNSGSLAYISGLYTQLHSDIGDVLNPIASVMYGAMNTYFNSAFSQSLSTIYLDFLKQRALNHNTASQLGHTGEVVAGFAEGLFSAGTVEKYNVDLATCSKNKVNRTWGGIDQFATRAIVVNPTGVLPAGSTNPTLIVKITPSASSVGALWNGFTYRAIRPTPTGALVATNRFITFGIQAGDQVVVLVANLDPANTGTFAFEIGCEGPVITALAPTKGPVDTAVTITGSGFGTSTDTRYVYFNGLKASNVTWSSDTVAVAKVPQNASSGEVVVEVNTVKSNGVNFDVLAQCSSTQNAGGDTPDTRTIELGKPAGTFDFSYETYSQQDQILVKYQGNTIFDTGCLGTNGTKTKTLTYNGSTTQIVVQVIPNCKGGSGTAWNYTVACPK